VAKAEAKGTFRDPTEKPAFEGIPGKRVPQAGDGIDHRRNARDSGRDASVHDRFECEVVDEARLKPAIKPGEIQDCQRFPEGIQVAPVQTDRFVSEP
jgi:hypothetical protein